MKIAICYSGYIRTLSETISNNLEFFSQYDVDLYFSLWEHVGYSDRINSPEYIISNRILDKNIKVTENLVNSLAPNQNIKKIKIEKYCSDNFKFDLTNGFDNNGLHGQYYKIYNCFQLLDDSTNYDLVVRLRCDMLLNNKMNDKFLQNIVANNLIVFPNKIWYDHCWDVNKNSINEMMWISNKKLMNKACNIYNNSNSINKIISNSKQTHKNYGENICFMNLQAENIHNNITTFDFDYQILR